ncbi:MAG: serine--tRNA ligase [Patescibacteria group bacterium]
MLDFKLIKNNLEEWEKGLKRKGAKFDLDKLVKEWDEYSTILQSVETLRADKNAAARAKDIPAGKKIGGELGKQEKKLKDLEESLEQMSGELPNLPMIDVPDGGEDDGKVVGSWGESRKIKNPKDHIELGKSLNILDIERGAKASGARFYYLKNQAVQLEFALVNFVLDIAGKNGFEFLVGPQLLSERAMMAGGYLGKAKDEVYKTQDDLYLNGTAEQSILAYHLDEIIDVPKRYAGFSTCFRREAGSYGKDVKGIIRTHQFDKIELFSFVAPEESEKEHEFLVGLQEEILQKLEIPYQKVLLAAGDLGMSAAKTIDLESWIPSQKRFRETHSCSNCTDWQARRANIRFKNKDGKSEFVHTLNGTGVAVGRLLVALLENHQQGDGSIKIPEALQDYCGFEKIK